MNSLVSPISIAFKHSAWSADVTEVRRAFRAQGVRGSRMLDMATRLVRGGVGGIEIRLSSTKHSTRSGKVVLDRFKTEVTFTEAFDGRELRKRYAKKEEDWEELAEWLEDNLVEVEEGGPLGIVTHEVLPSHTYTSFNGWVDAVAEVDDEHVSAVQEAWDTIEEGWG